MNLLASLLGLLFGLIVFAGVSHWRTGLYFGVIPGKSKKKTKSSSWAEVYEGTCPHCGKPYHCLTAGLYSCDCGRHFVVGRIATAEENALLASEEALMAKILSPDFHLHLVEAAVHRAFSESHDDFGMVMFTEDHVELYMGPRNPARFLIGYPNIGPHDGPQMVTHACWNYLNSMPHSSYTFTKGTRNIDWRLIKHVRAVSRP